MSDRLWTLSKNRDFFLSNGRNPRPTQGIPPPNVAGALSRVRGQSFYTVIPPTTSFSASNPPWRLKEGETIYDGMPTGVPVVNAADFSASTDLYIVLTAVLAGTTGDIYVQLASQTYFINTARNLGTPTNPNWIGFHNSSRLLGLIGAGFDGSGEFLTLIVASSTMVSSSPDNCRTFMLNAVKPNPIPFSSLYFTNASSTKPLFISGISFDGTLQGPFGVYSVASQAAFSRNQGVSSPLPWKGMSIWRAVPGSKMQFCRFRGFSFALNSAPPFECGTVDTNYCNLQTRRIELDGRIASYIDAARPRASGGFMYNKEINSSMEESWMHHTRRSGMATNTNTLLYSEQYTFKTYQSESIADIDPAVDAWASDGAVPYGFNSWNVENVVGHFNITDGYANSNQGHINLAIAAAGFPGGTAVLGPHSIINVNGFRTDETLYNGCLRIGTPQRPNSTGNSPIWTALNTDFAGSCDKYFVIKDKNGNRLAPVKASLFNAALHGPATHYVLRNF